MTDHISPGPDTSTGIPKYESHPAADILAHGQREYAVLFEGKGTRRDAILFACAANSAHGLRRTNADKRKAITTLLADAAWAKRSDRWIAEQCGVNHETVRDVRTQLADSASSHQRGLPAGSSFLTSDDAPEPLPEKTIGRDGKERTSNDVDHGEDRGRFGVTEIEKGVWALTFDGQLFTHPDNGWTSHRAAAESAKYHADRCAADPDFLLFA